MKPTMKKTPLIVAVLSVMSATAGQVLADDAASMDHSQMNHEGMDHGDMPMAAPAMDHSGMDHSGMDHSGMDHSGMDHSGMDHSQMNHSAMGHEGMGHDSMNHGEMNHDMSGMQGGTAPANARDPHAYSGGYTLTSGPYAMEGPRQLVLADEHWFSSLSLEQLGVSRSGDETSKVAEGEYWIGSTWDRLALSFDIDRLNGETEAELGGYWRHAITAFWNTQLGVKHERGEDESRNWVGVGFQGLAPYWFESEAMLFVGEQGVTMLELSAEYEILLTQRWIIAVEADANLAGKDDPEREFASGLVSTSVAPRLRYEISRQFAPFVGVQRSHWYGDSADLQESSAETSWQAGVRLWF